MMVLAGWRMSNRVQETTADKSISTTPQTEIDRQMASNAIGSNNATQSPVIPLLMVQTMILSAKA